jgi:hypothetical protein
VRPHGPGEFGELRYTVPADTTLASVSGHRSARVTGSVPYGTNTASLFLGGLRAEFFADVGSENRAASGAIAYAAPSGSTYFRVLMECSGSSTCPQTDSWYRISQLRIGLLDTFDPAIKDVTGSITSPAAAQSKTVGVSTSDRGGGVRTVQFRVDGGAWQDSGSFCSAPYRLRVPCPLARSHSFSIDTRPLPDGDRSVTLRAVDVAGGTSALLGPYRFLVDNKPPTVAGVTVTGTPRDGDELSCTARAEGQSPSTSYAWIRTAPDGTGRTTIPGATSSTLRLGPDDVGMKVLCRATATDGGGSASAESSPTAAPFADGRTVSAYCSGRPTGRRDPCGDLDGDGRVNREDQDADGDGVESASDPDDLDATRTGLVQTASYSGGPASAPVAPVRGSGDPAAAAVGSAVNGAGGGSDVLLALGAERGGSTVVTVPFGQGATFVGRLTNRDGAPVRGARLELASQVRVSGSPLQGGGEAITGEDGRFRAVVPAGPSRVVRVVYRARPDGLATRTLDVVVKVRAGLRFGLSRRTVRNGRVLRYLGRLQGVATGGKYVEVQVRAGREWIEVCSVRTDRRGAFACRHRFTRTFKRTKYVFRARVLRQRGLPYEPATSRTRAVLVNP